MSIGSVFGLRQPALSLLLTALFVCGPCVGTDVLADNGARSFPGAVTGKAGSGTTQYTTVTRTYGPFDVVFYNNGDSDGWDSSEANWTETQMSDVGACIATWDAKIANVPGRQIKLHMFWYGYSGGILGGSYSPSNGDGTKLWSYPERVWRDGVNYDGRWDGFDTTISYDTDAAGFGWNFGSGAPSGSQVDFRSVVTHELGHALGFYDSYDNYFGDWGNAYGTEANPYEWANQPGLSAWDKLLRDDAGNRPSTGGYGTPGNFNELDNPVWFTGAQATAMNGGPVPIYAPSSFEAGSSLAHLNDATFPNALMKHAISLGQVNRQPTELEWTVMKDMGWTIVPEPASWTMLVALVAMSLIWRARRQSTRAV